MPVHARDLRGSREYRRLAPLHGRPAFWAVVNEVRARGAFELLDAIEECSRDSIAARGSTPCDIDLLEGVVVAVASADASFSSGSVGDEV